jgi:hypothetical protein
MPKIGDLPEIIDGLNPSIQEVVERLFDISRIHAKPSPSSGRHKALSTKSQRIVRISNRWTYEGASFDEERLRRAPTEDPFFQRLLERCQEPQEPCWFCPESAGGKFPNPTPGQHCWTLDPPTRFDAYHTLIVFTEHNPLVYKEEAIADYLATGEEWAKGIRETTGQKTVFYLFTWNSLCGSAIHGHAQVTLSPDFPHSRVALWAEAANRYRARWGQDYFQDLWLVHQSLGLGREVGPVKVLASLTPVKERECLLWVRPEETADVPRSLARALIGVLRTFQADAPRGLFAFNLAIYQPPIGKVPPGWENFPTVVRIVDRGWPMLGVTDVASMELYASSIVASDPLQLMAGLQAHFCEEVL